MNGRQINRCRDGRPGRGRVLYDRVARRFVIRADRQLHQLQITRAGLLSQRDGQKVVLAVRNMGGESEAAWRSLLDALLSRGPKAAEFVIVDGAPGLAKALGPVWQTVLPSAETAAMRFWALLASGQITMRKVGGWPTLAEAPAPQCIDLAA